MKHTEESFTLEALRAAIEIQADIAASQRKIMLDQENRITALEKRLDKHAQHNDDVIATLTIATAAITQNTDIISILTGIEVAREL